MPATTHCVPSNSVPPPLRRTDFTAQAGLKLIAGAVFSGLFTGIFKVLQRTPLAEPHVWARCWTWDQVAFSSAWTLPYMSLFPLIAIAWYAQRDWRELRRFLTAMFAAAMCGWIPFLFFPTASARPPLEGTSLLYQWLAALDLPTNSSPALHSAFATVAAVGLVHGATRVGWFWQVLVWLWVAVIAHATVVLRQHTDLDVLGGFVVGGVVAWLYRRSFASTESREGNVAAPELAEPVATFRRQS